VRYLTACRGGGSYLVAIANDGTLIEFSNFVNNSGADLFANAGDGNVTLRECFFQDNGIVVFDSFDSPYYVIGCVFDVPFAVEIGENESCVVGTRTTLLISHFDTAACHATRIPPPTGTFTETGTNIATETESISAIQTEIILPPQTDDNFPPQTEIFLPPQTDDNLPPQTEIFLPPQTDNNLPPHTDTNFPIQTPIGIPDVSLTDLPDQTRFADPTFEPDTGADEGSALGIPILWIGIAAAAVLVIIGGLVAGCHFCKKRHATYADVGDPVDLGNLDEFLSPDGKA
jgi:hypothetical protein